MRWLALITIMGAACSFDPRVPPGARITCDDNADCPADFACVPARAKPVKICCPVSGCVEAATWSNALTGDGGDDGPTSLDAGGLDGSGTPDTSDAAPVDARALLPDVAGEARGLEADAPADGQAADAPADGVAADAPVDTMLAPAEASPDVAGPEAPVVDQCAGKSCGPADGCCPAGCSNPADPDCDKAAGQACLAAGECLSGACADGRCCAQVCGACQACTGPGGTCQSLARDAEDREPADTCAGNRACDGNGQCRTKQGEPCGSPADCLTGFCADGVCCNGACTGTCRSCAQSGTRGVCSPVRNAADPDTCAGAASCDVTGVCAGLSGAPGALAFPATAVKTTSETRRVNITNAAGAPMSGLLDVRIAGANYDQFKVVGVGCAGVALGGGSSCGIDVRFEPQGAGDLQAELVVSGDPGGTVRTALAGSAYIPPTLSVEPARLDFQCMYNASLADDPNCVDRTFTFTNNGTLPLGPVATAIEGDGSVCDKHFAVVNDYCGGQTLPKMGTCTVVARFAPRRYGMFSASLKVSAGSVSATGALAGHAYNSSIIILDTTCHDFEGVTVGQTRERTFSIRNDITPPRSLSFTLTTEGDNNGLFQLDAGDSAFDLGAGDTRVVRVTFQPTSPGRVTTRLVARVLGGWSPPAYVRLFGTAN